MSKSKPVEPIVPVFSQEQLPSDWNLVPIGEICLPVEKVNPKDRPDAKFDYIDISGIDNSLFRIDQTKRYAGRQAPSRARQLVKAGDIVFSTVRTYLKNLARVTPEYDGQIASTGFCVLRPAKPEFSKYLYYYMQYEPFLNQLAKHQRGTSYPAVRDGDIFAQLIPLPQTHEVAPIVAEIEKQFSRLDEAAANLNRVKSNLKRYKAAVLKAAVEGKLSEEWRKAHPHVEPTSELLKRVLAERRKKWNGKGEYKEPAPIDPGPLPQIPEGWVYASAESICGSVRDGTHDTPAYIVDGIPLITSKNLLPSGLDFNETKLISHEDHAEISKRSGVEEGDVLFAMIGTVGNPVVIETKRPFSIKNVGLLKKNPKCILARYLKTWLMSPQFKAWLEPKQRGTTQKFVPLGLLRAFAVALPPLSEQQQILAEVERRLSVIENLDAALMTEFQRVDRLRSSILRDAFSGRLDSQTHDLTIRSREQPLILEV